MKDEYDTMIILQTEYNKMTGESLEKDVAFEMARAICNPKKIEPKKKIEPEWKTNGDYLPLPYE